MDTTTALRALRSLTAAELRQRLDEMDGEAEMVRVLLRATVARDRVLTRGAELRRLADAEPKGGARAE